MEGLKEKRKKNSSQKFSSAYSNQTINKIDKPCCSWEATIVYDEKLWPEIDGQVSIWQKVKPTERRLILHTNLTYYLTNHSHNLMFERKHCSPDSKNAPGRMLPKSPQCEHPILQGESGECYRSHTAQNISRGRNEIVTTAGNILEVVTNSFRLPKDNSKDKTTH